LVDKIVVPGDLMDSNQPRKTGTAFEYFLYAAILAETALAALLYKVIFRDTELVHLRLYFAIFYFAFLAWAIAQLNVLNRRRKSLLGDSPSPDAPPNDAPPPAEKEIVAEETHGLLGLTGQQFAIVLVVFATAVAAFSLALRMFN
jgi:hypothetical protein